MRTYYNEDEFVKFHERTSDDCVDNLPYRAQVKHWLNMQEASERLLTQATKEEVGSRATEELAILADVMWLTAEEAAEEIGVTLKRMLFWLTDGQIKAKNVNGKKGSAADWWIHRGDFEDFLESRHSVPVPQTFAELRDRHKFLKERSHSGNAKIGGRSQRGTVRRG